MLVSIIIPCYNEEEGIPHLMEELGKLPRLPHKEYDFEFIFVDDGSEDRTYELLNKRYKELKNAKIIRHEGNKGFGQAMRTGLQSSNGDMIVCYDSDCTYPVEDIIRLIDSMDNKTDIVTASPYHPDGKAEEISSFRLFLSRGLSLVYRIVLGSSARNIHTFSCAFRVYRRSVIENIDFKSNGFLAASEILCLAIKKGYKVKDIPSRLSVRKFGSSKMRVLKTIYDHIKFIKKLLFS